jgi:hypothetical protein
MMKLDFMPKMRIAVVILTAVFMSGCGGGTPTPDAADNIFSAATSTPFVAAERPTLPPTWTPTATATPPPPTATITLTPTWTPSPTLSAAAICERFFSTTNLRSGQYFAFDSRISIYTNAAASDATILFEAVHHRTGDIRSAAIPGGQANILQLPIRNLPGTGQYDWTLKVNTPAYGDICVQTGYFFATSQESTRGEEDEIR